MGFAGVLRWCYDGFDRLGGASERHRQVREEAATVTLFVELAGSGVNRGLGFWVSVLCGCLMLEWGSSQLGDSEMKVIGVEDF